MAAALTLVVPGCCGPLPEKTAILKYFDPALAQLQLWKALSRGVKTSAAASFQSQLAALFQHTDSEYPFPAASLDRLGETGLSDQAYWLHADPVCMQADMDHAILFDAHSLQLAEHEAEQLVAELNAHFSQDGIELQRGTASNWYLSIAANSAFVTSPLHEVVGRNVNLFMPVGVDARHWKRFMNEAQMLLHASEVNQQREARGHLPVNSLWLWGEGCLPAAASQPPNFDYVLANHASARGLAKLNTISCEPVPTDVAAVAGLLTQHAHVCLVLDQLGSSINYADVGAWQEDLLALHESWLQPLLQHAANDNIPVQLYPCNGYQYHLRSVDKYRLWRRGSLQTHLSLYA